MAAITFDTLSTARRLREKGMLQEHAEAIADELRLAAQVDVAHLATKEEVSSFKSELKADLRELELRLDARFKDVQLKIGGMLMALGGILIAVRYFG
jgi:hypothetical protein